MKNQTTTNDTTETQDFNDLGTQILISQIIEPRRNSSNKMLSLTVPFLRFKLVYANLNLESLTTSPEEAHI
jgi:hypothetical protein